MRECERVRVCVRVFVPHLTHEIGARKYAEFANKPSWKQMDGDDVRALNHEWSFAFNKHYKSSERYKRQLNCRNFKAHIWVYLSMNNLEDLLKKTQRRK